MVTNVTTASSTVRSGFFARYLRNSMSGVIALSCRRRSIGNAMSRRFVFVVFVVRCAAFQLFDQVEDVLLRNVVVDGLIRALFVQRNPVQVLIVEQLLQLSDLLRQTTTD